MSRKSAQTRRLRQAIAIAAASGRTVYRHADGSTLSLADGLVLDAFLAMDDSERPTFSPEAITFLAECEIAGPMSDVEAALIESARGALGELHGLDTLLPHSGASSPVYPTPTLPQEAQVDDPNSPEGRP